MKTMTTECDMSKTLPDLVLDIDNDDEDTNQSSQQEDTLCSENSQSNLTDNLTAGTSQGVSTQSNKQSNCEEQKCNKGDSRATPLRAQLNNSRGNVSWCQFYF